MRDWSSGIRAMDRATEATGSDRDVLLSVEGVGKDFGHFAAVRAVSISVRRGELKAIVGVAMDGHDG
jgi:ABC-type uncharacterized transport system ATPase subunit